MQVKIENTYADEVKIKYDVNMFHEQFLKLIKKKQRLEKKDFKLNRDLDMAKRVHEGLLDIDIPECQGLKIAKHSQPADKIGGDFYNFFTKNPETMKQKEAQTGIIEYISHNHPSLSILIGDVAGHGIASALVMALTCGIVTKNNLTQNNVADVLMKTNNDLYQHIANTDIPYVTGLLAKIELNSKKMYFVNAGHCPMIHQKGDQIRFLEGGGLFMGMYENETYQIHSVNLTIGDRLIFYTDGIHESKGLDNQRFGLNRFEEALIEQKDESAQKALDNILEHINNFEGPFKNVDDRTLIIVDIV